MGMYTEYYEQDYRIGFLRSLWVRWFGKRCTPYGGCLSYLYKGRIYVIK